MSNENETIVKLMFFCVFWVPILLGPQAYIVYRVMTGIKVRKGLYPQQEQRKYNFFSYLIVFVIVLWTCILFLFVFIESPHFLIKLAFFGFVLPFYLVALGSLAGLKSVVASGFPAVNLISAIFLKKTQNESDV
jgi:hypothetical protein